MKRLASTTQRFAAGVLGAALAAVPAAGQGIPGAPRVTPIRHPGEAVRRLPAPTQARAQAPDPAELAAPRPVAPIEEPPVAPIPVAPATPAPASAPTTGSPGVTYCAPAPAPGFWARCKQSWRDNLWGKAEEFEAPPLGVAVYAHGRAMVAHGEAARMVLYHYDFVDNAPNLKPRGLDQLAQIASLLPGNFYPVVVQRTGVPELDEARRVAVFTELNRGRFPIPAERVLLGPPPANGLSGVEAAYVNQNLLDQTEKRGKINLNTSGGTPSSQQGLGGLGAILGLGGGGGR